MTNIQKFFSDTKRIIKHDRADNNGTYDGSRCSKRIISLFESNLSQFPEIARSLGDYWFTTYIQPSSEINNEPTQEHLDWLANILSLFDGELEENHTFTKQDWQEIRDTINYEAESLPLDFLSSIMNILLEQGILN